LRCAEKSGPLTHKQLVSMKKMSKVQPKVETIRAKWATKIKTDPQARMKMNEEMMGLYKTEGINPAGGCLPLLLQMPILVAFYNLLAHSIELRTSARNRSISTGSGINWR